MIDLYPLAAPVLRAFDPETAHRLTLKSLRLGFGPVAPAGDDPALAVNVLGLEFSNPVGLAAGFDKNAEVPDAMLGMGFGFVEIGSVTPLAQPGNPRPRLFRLPEDRAVINRNGFNNEGLDVVAGRLEARRSRPGIVGANIGANKDAADRIADYVTGLTRMAPLCDYLAINISSPNTSGLRDLQGGEALNDLLARLLEARAEITAPNADPLPLLVKIAPDLDRAGAEAIARAVTSHAIDGMIISNTTIAREGLQGRHREETGGLSGAPLFAPSTELLGRMYRLTEGRLTLIGVGGVSSGAEAYAKIRAGASLVQLYTAMVYEGPALVGRIKSELAGLLKADGIEHLADALGVDIPIH